MEIVQIHAENRHLVADFLKHSISPYFRYFATRGLDALQNHIYTIVGCIEGVPVAYGHLDFEEKLWLGVCVAEPWKGKGYGRQVFRDLLEFFYTKSSHAAIYLTVDDENEVAKHMYQKAGFVQNENGWCLERSISLPVSFGEAFDKLSILEIKLAKIKDEERRIFVAEEHRILSEKLHRYMSETVRFHFAILRQINMMIWVMQDIFRDSKSAEEKSKLCSRIIEENDRRFRVKHKIDSVLRSSIKEQKGYTMKKALILPHQGLGDLITNIGLIRYYATFYDNVRVITSHVSNAKLFFADDPTIQFFEYKSFFENIDPNTIKGEDISIIERVLHANSSEYTIIPLGLFKDGVDFNAVNIPFCFYEQCGINPQIFWDYFHIPTCSESTQYCAKIRQFMTDHHVKDYVFVHNQTSKGDSFDPTLAEDIFGIQKDSSLLLNPNCNLYTADHPFYAIANEFIGKPLAFYKDVMIHADHIVLTGSSFFCMALNLEIQTKSCYVVEYNTNYNYIYDPEYLHSSYHTRTKFRNIFDDFNFKMPLCWYMRNAYDYSKKWRNVVLLECGSHQMGEETREFREENECYYIEANPTDYEVMRKQPSVPDGRVFNYALSDHCGNVSFTVSSWPGNSSVSHSDEHKKELEDYGATLKTIEVPCITYAHFINEIIRKPVDFLVLDIEGYECTVLESMLTLSIEKLPLFICIEAGYNWLERKVLLEKLGYTIDFYMGNNVIVSRSSNHVVKRINHIREFNQQNPRFVWRDLVLYENDAEYR